MAKAWKIVEDGVIVNGEHFPLLPHLCFWFEVGTPHTERTGFDLEGVGGVRLSNIGKMACAPSMVPTYMGSQRVHRAADSRR